ncbi:zinc finger family protein [Echinococcus multilocularis]|uniref:Zinc finger family protein n=1 Tax=Echinococcus multilocularis TaxID=6211 RepID=A0A0S4MS35_ECHMU|nr:zinc finger family protein [Echinococcus multilocularis]
MKDRGQWTNFASVHNSPAKIDEGDTWQLLTSVHRKHRIWRIGVIQLRETWLGSAEASVPTARQNIHSTP